MADLDGFQQINDRLGRLTGDAVLRHAAHSLSANVRQYDSLGRYGGGKFLVVLPGCDQAGCFAQAERPRAAPDSGSFDLPGYAALVTSSFCVTAAESMDTLDAGRLLREAGATLYQAKRAGRNRVEAFSGLV